MKLVQTTLFGVRGESFRIKKRSPLTKLAAGEKVDFHLRIGGDVTSAGHTVLEVWPRPNNFGCDVARISGMSGWVATAALTRTPAEKTPHAERPTPNSERRGEADGCLIGLVAMVLFTIGLMMAGPCTPRLIRVQWLKEYPDPVCERCGKVLDGESNECFEEGTDQ